MTETVKRVSHGGIGSPGPRCPICDSKTVWLSHADDMTVYYQCGTCLRAYEFWGGTVVWWPNDLGVLPPKGGLDEVRHRLKEPRSYTIAVTPIKKPKSYSIAVKPMAEAEEAI